MKDRQKLMSLVLEYGLACEEEGRLSMLVTRENAHLQSEAKSDRILSAISQLAERITAERAA